jgi:hypothetical protein
MRRYKGIAAALALITLAPDAAFACRGYQFWSTGDDLSKLKPGEIVVMARLVSSYKNEQRFEHSIMGLEYGMVYHLRLSDVVGGAADNGLRAGSNVLVRLPPSICEVYVPRDFSKDSDKRLVLKQMPDGVFDLVGGKE